MRNYLRGVKKRKWLYRNWWWFVPAVVAVSAGGGFLVLTLAIFIMKSSPVYIAAVEVARRDDRVISQLGEPIEPGFIISGSTESTSNFTRSVMEVPLSGPRGSGTLRFTGLVSEGQVDFHELVFVDLEGKHLDINPRRSGEP